MHLSQIHDDWPGTFATCDLWVCLLPFCGLHPPLPPSPLSASDRHVPLPLQTLWPLEEGGGGLSEACKCRGKGALQQGAGQVGAALCSPQEVSGAAAERSRS